MASNQKFTEIVKPGTNIDFIGTKRVWIGISILLTLLTVTMLFLNAYVIPGRGHMLNWGVDLKGGSELQVDFTKPVQAGPVRQALEGGGFHGAEVIALGSARSDQSASYLIRMGAVSALSREQFRALQEKLTKVDDAAVRSIEFSEGGDKLYVRTEKAVEAPRIAEALKAQGVSTVLVQSFGRPEDHTYEAMLVSIKEEVHKALDAKLGAGAVKSIPSVASVGARAGQELRNNGIKALIGAILLIVVYIAFRFDFRYGPGTIVAILHDAVMTIGAFALTYKEFSLTTLAALLTIIGFSMNDTIVVFDRIRENAAKHRDQPFERVVNLSVNETLSRTILTSGTTFFVTLAMNVFGTGVIRDFAFALNVGIVVGTYSTVFIASPVLIWLNDKYLASQGRLPRERGGRRATRTTGETAET
jgi:preprotein translocase subunit SecF